MRSLFLNENDDRRIQGVVHVDSNQLLYVIIKGTWIPSNRYESSWLESLDVQNNLISNNLIMKSNFYYKQWAHQILSYSELINGYE
jgi:hypothetical protein